MPELRGDVEVRARLESIERFLHHVCDGGEFPWFVSDDATIYDVCLLEEHEIIARVQSAYGTTLGPPQLHLPIWKLVDALGSGQTQWDDVVGRPAMMGTVHRHAQRLLGAVRGEPRQEPVFPGYASLPEGPPPAWWSHDRARPEWGTVVGIYENEPDAPIDAIVVAELGLAVLGSGDEVTWLPYREISGWEPLSKDPPARALVVRTRSGQEATLRFDRGGALAFVQFLILAIRDARSQLG